MPWTEQNGNWDIQSNKARVAADGVGNHATVPSVDADVIIDVKLTPQYTDINNREDGSIMLRYSDATHHWLVAADSHVDEVAIYELDGGATKRANTAVTIDGNIEYEVRAIAYGTTIDGYVDGGNKVTYGSASLNSTIEVHGLRTFITGTPPASASFDDFVIYARDGFSALDAY